MNSETQVTDQQLAAAPTAPAEQVRAIEPLPLRAALVPLLLIAGTVVVLDRITKLWILDTLGGAQGEFLRQIIPGWLQLRYVENTGAAFGLFKDGGWALAIIAVLVIGGIIYAAPRVYRDATSPAARWQGLLGLGLLLGGAIGNLSDRFLYGYVVDFVDFYGLYLTIDNRRYQWAVFNVADSAISVGILLLLFSVLFGQRKRDADT